MAFAVIFPPLTDLSRRRALLLVALMWAAIYLPALGSLELKGEEGRRLLPAVSMLETGKWIVPSVGGVPYLSKPPLINWLAAGAFRVAGSRSEWAARAPSALAVLALGLATVGALSAWLTPAGALLAAIFLLTNIGLMEKGRLAEIEALYLSLYGIALVLWLGAWRREAGAVPGARPTWRAWTLPWAFLGLGLLTKGPLHLVFFYAVVVAVLFYARRLRDLWNWPHLGGIALMLAIFGAWSVPYLQQVAAHRAGDVWLTQFQSRMEVSEGFHAGAWALNIPRGLGNFLPWVVLVPLWWRRWAAGEGEGLDHAVLRGGRWAVTICFLAVSLAPGGQPRYTLPLLVPASVSLALVFARSGGAWPAWLPLVWRRVVLACFWAVTLGSAMIIYKVGKESWLLPVVLGVGLLGGVLVRRLCRWPGAAPWIDLGVASAVVMALITADFAIGAVPWFRRTEMMRPMAAQLDAAVPPGEPLAVLRPGFVPFLYYLRPGLIYVQRIDELPAPVHYLLVREDDSRTLLDALRARHMDWRISLRVSDKRLHGDSRSAWMLVRLNPLPEASL